jgi:hypothetical protein
MGSRGTELTGSSEVCDSCPTQPEYGDAGDAEETFLLA